MAEAYKLKYLTGRRLAVFLAAADRIIPPDADSPGSDSSHGGTLKTAAVVDWSMERMDPGLRRQLLLLFLMIEPLGLLFGLKPFTMLPGEKQDRLLKFMEDNPVRLLRLGFFGLKAYCNMGYYTREDIWPTIGYDGPIEKNRPYPDPVIRALARGEMEVLP